MANRVGLGLIDNAGPVEHAPVAHGYVSTTKPAPSSFADPLWVIVPNYSTESPYKITKWGALHGSTLPTQGALVTVLMDDENVPAVAWWEARNLKEGYVEPKHTRALKTPYTPSIIQACRVTLTASKSAGNREVFTVFVGEQAIAELVVGPHTAEGTLQSNLTFDCPAGQTWHVEAGTNGQIESTYYF